MSILFKLNGQHLWWPATGVAIRFLEVLRSLETHVDCPSGISPIVSDEVTVDPQGLSVFLRACLNQNSLWQHRSLHMLYHGLLAHLFAMMIEHDPTFLSPDDDVPEEMLKSIKDCRRAVRLYDLPERPPDTGPPYKYTPCQWTSDQLAQRSDWRVHLVLVNSKEHLRVKIGSHDPALVDRLTGEFEKECEHHGAGSNSQSKVAAFRAACEDMIMQSPGSVRETGSWTNPLRILARHLMQNAAIEPLALHECAANAFYEYVQFLKSPLDPVYNVLLMSMLDQFIAGTPFTENWEGFAGEYYVALHPFEIRQIVEALTSVTSAGVPPEFDSINKAFLESLSSCGENWLFLTCSE